MTPEAGRPGRRPRTSSLVERAVEQAKRFVPRPARWMALGAGLLMAGCEPGEQETRPEQTEVLKRFDFDNSFPVDLAKMNPEAEAQVKAQVEQFLTEHNSPQTFGDLKKSRIAVEVSSDERPTKAWGEKGNEALSEARLEELDTVLREAIKTYDFADDIPAQDVDAFKHKMFTKRMPGGEWGRGVTPLTRLTNPETGTLYTETEVKKLSRAERAKLFDQARYAEVTFELPGQNEVEHQYDKLVDIMSGYDNVTFLVDRSGSMLDDYQRLGHSFSEALGKRQADFVSDTTYIVPFEQNADLARYQNIPADQVPQYLRTLRLPGRDERLFTSLRQVVDQKIQTPETAQRRAIIVLTDEGIQDFAAANLRRLVADGEVNQIDMYFALIGEDGLITFADQRGLLYEYEQYVAMYEPQSQANDLDQETHQAQLDRDGNIVFGKGVPSMW
ncbi:MAG: vWA domain-containing protein [Patescibacteria group bacterium]